MHLYEINEALLAAIAKAEQAAIENEGEIPEGLAADLDALELARDEKIGNCIAWLKSEQAMADALTTEAKRLSVRADHHTKNAEWMKGYLSACVGEKNKWEGTQGKISWRKASAVVIGDATKVPIIYTRLVPETRVPDKKAIADAIGNGVEIPECEVVTKQHIQIK